MPCSRLCFLVVILPRTATLHDTWQYIWKRWVPTSGLKPAPTPDFERYDERFNTTTGQGPIEIWSPIQRQH